MEKAPRLGYDAELLPAVCEVYLKYRDDCLAKDGKLPATQEHIIYACDAVMRGLARVGIVALIDEATGYQEVQDQRHCNLFWMPSFVKSLLHGLCVFQRILRAFLQTERLELGQHFR